MADYNVTHLFESLGAGWSETWATTGASASEVLVKAKAIAQNRGSMLSTGGPNDVGPAKIVGLRIQNLADALDLYVETLDIPGTYKAEDPEGPDQPWTGVLLRVTAANGSRRMFCLRGVDDGAITGSYKTPIVEPTLQKAIAAWAAKLTSLGFCIRGQNRGVGNPLKVISALVPVAAGIEVTTAVNHGLANNALIRFENVRSVPTITGQYAILVTAVNKFVALGPNLGTLTFLSGQYRDVLREMSVVNLVQIGRKSERKAGRPFFLLRGRR